MSLVRERLVQIQKNIEQREQGKYNLIPFHYHFPDLSEYVPGLFKGTMNKLLSGTGVGKSLFTKWMTIFLPYELKQKIGLKYKTIYFALEESRDEFIDGMIVNLLYRRKGIKIDRMQLNSYKSKPLDKETLQAIFEIEKDIEDILEDVDIVDNLYSPTGCYKYVRNIAQNLGTYHTKKMEFYDSEANKTFIQDVFSHYEPNDPELFLIVVADHISLLGESNLTQHETIERWSDEYCRKQLAKNIGVICWNVQQVNQSSDDAFHQKMGRLEVSLSDAANNKEVTRSDHVIYSLFDPVRYGMGKHLGYDITKLNQHYRALSILKNRYGQSNISKGLLFDGKTGIFSELPKPTDERISKLYQALSKQ